MLIAWTQHLKTEEEKQHFERSVRASSHVLEHLDSLIQKDIAGTELAERSVKAYDNANWAYRQAHVNGYISAMNKVSALLKLKENSVDRTEQRISVKTRGTRKEIPNAGSVGGLPIGS